MLLGFSVFGEGWWLISEGMNMNNNLLFNCHLYQNCILKMLGFRRLKGGIHYLSNTPYFPLIAQRSA